MTPVSMVSLYICVHTHIYTQMYVCTYMYKESSITDIIVFWFKVSYYSNFSLEIHHIKKFNISTHINKLNFLKVGHKLWGNTGASHKRLHYKLAFRIGS